MINCPCLTQLSSADSGGAARLTATEPRQSRADYRPSALNSKGKGVVHWWGQSERNEGHLTSDSGAEIPGDDEVRLHDGVVTPTSNSPHNVGLPSQLPTRTTSLGIGVPPRSHPEDENPPPLRVIDGA